MNVVHPLPRQQGSPPNQFQNICKICKKVFKDKAGLMQHQKQQHPQQPPPSISIAQKIQRLQQQNSLQLKKAPYSNGNFEGRRLEPQETQSLQKSPPNLIKSRKQQFHSPNGESFLREDSAEVGDDTWGKRPKKEEDPPTIIDGTLAAATAACYNPDPSASNSNGQARPNAPGIREVPPVSSSVQLMKSKLNPQHVSKIQQNMSAAAGNLVAGRQTGMSPNGKAGVNRAPVPKLMSKTKAQYQILKSQTMRPRIPPKVVVADAARVVGQNPPAVQVQMSAPASVKVEMKPQIPAGQGPPKAVLSPFGGIQTKQLSQTMKPRIPPGMSSTTNANFEDSALKLGLGARRGAANVVGRGRGSLSTRGGGVRPVNTYNKAPPSHKTEIPSDEDEESSSESEDEEEFKPPPQVKVKSGSPTRGRHPPSTKPPKNLITPPSSARRFPPKEPEEEERIFGKNYKCPPMDKKASYLNKKGERVWVCLVCDQTEQEISRGPMICCDGCEDWYHFFCVGIEKEPPESEKWYCKRCIFKKLNKKRSHSDSDSEEDEEEPSNARRGSSPRRSSPPKRGRGGGRGGRGGRGGKRGRN